MSISKVQLTGGNFQDSEGNVLNLGYLTMELNQDESVNDSQICHGVKITIKLNSSGSVVTSPTQSVWGNDQMFPINSFYKVAGYNANGQLCWGPNNQQVTGNGGTFDVGSWTPNQVISWTPPLQPLALQVNEVSNGSQALLDLHEGSNITLTDNGSGRVTIAGAAGISLETNEVPNSSQTLLDLHAGINIGLGEVAGEVTITNKMPAASTIQFAVPNWVTTSADWRESPYPTSGGNWDLKTQSSNVGGTSALSFVQATATIAPYWKYLSASGTTSFVSLYGNTNSQYLGLTKIFKIRSAFFTSTLVRNWVGITSGGQYISVNGFESNNPAYNIVGFRYSAGTDSFWTAYCSTNDSHFTASATTVAVDITGVLHDFSFGITQGTPGTVYFYIDGVLVATINSNVPSATTAMSPILYSESLDNAATPGIGCNLVYSETFQ